MESLLWLRTAVNVFDLARHFANPGEVTNSMIKTLTELATRLL
ncbi:hypothetical protein [Nocardia cyriacigeorgica]|nr:hypothetical protein [Nocardia cyriacigeorgica]